MDTLHSMMRTLRPDAKSAARRGAGHLTVFREFLRHLDGIQRKAPVKPARPAHPKPPPRRKPAKRAR
ncbi:MAG: hypothetical protein M9932_04750 [Xanthobacteraceae bacterium]|nr:hypothetical protein [Xanthobacteraceae bacterium]